MRRGKLSISKTEESIFWIDLGNTLESLMLATLDGQALVSDLLLRIHGCREGDVLSSEPALEARVCVSMNL